MHFAKEARTKKKKIFDIDFRKKGKGLLMVSSSLRTLEKTRTHPSPANFHLATSYIAGRVC